MKPLKIDNNQNELFKNRLSNQLNPKHEMFILSSMIPWERLEEEFSDMHVDGVNGGQPPKPVRLIAGLLLLQHMHNLSDDLVVRTWVENPYWQYFCGYDYLEWQFPVDPSSLTRWRNRLGKERMEKILSLTVSVAVDSGTIKQKDLERVIVDTTVMPKNIEFPTDSKLLNKSRKRLVKLAEENGIILRQNYNLKSKKLLRRIGGYLHAKQMKRARKGQKHLKTIVGRVKRDCERRIEGNAFLQEIFATELSMANHLLTRKVSDKKKIYSLHEPKVDCISKGKAHKRYEFGSKVALSITHKKGKMIITGCSASEGNPFDGRTLQSSIALSEKLTGVKVKRAFIDKGYKGHGVENKEIFMSGQRQGITATIKKQIKRRQAIEPHIGHMKQKVKLGLCRLHGVIGDQINAVLSAAAYNLRQVLRHLRYIFVQIILLLFGWNSRSVSKAKA